MRETRATAHAPQSSCNHAPSAAACEKGGDLLRCCSCPHAFHPECAGYGEAGACWALRVLSDMCRSARLALEWAMPPIAAHPLVCSAHVCTLAAGFEDAPVARSRWHCWYCAGAKGFKHPTSKVRSQPQWVVRRDALDSMHATAVAAGPAAAGCTPGMRPTRLPAIPLFTCDQPRRSRLADPAPAAGGPGGRQADGGVHSRVPGAAWDSVTEQGGQADEHGCVGVFRVLHVVWHAACCHGRSPPCSPSSA